MDTIASLVIMPSNAKYYEFLVEFLLKLAYNVPQSEIICLMIGPNSQWYEDIYACLHDNTLPPDRSNKARKTFIIRVLMVPYFNVLNVTNPTLSCERCTKVYVGHIQAVLPQLEKYYVLVITDPPWRRTLINLSINASNTRYTKT